jgi:microcin C transport system ATP-binding protein
LSEYRQKLHGQAFITPESATSARSDPLLSVSALSVSFNKRVVVHPCDFSIGRAERVALVGESGSGKTVSALSLLGLVRGAQVSGVCMFEGHDLFKLNETQFRGVRGRDIAMIFQEPMSALNPLFKAGEQIAEVLELKMALGRKEAWERAVELLGETGIEEPSRRAHAYPHQLSGGQRQRVMIAMALACRPKLLLADEPTTALDASLRKQILSLLERFQHEYNMSILMITHDLNLVRHFAGRVMVMQQGRLVEQGLASEVMSAPAHPYTRSLMDSVPVRRVIELSNESAQPTSGQASHEPIPLPLLKATELSVNYPRAIGGFKGWFKKGWFTAVDRVSFELGAGLTLGVVGESGSGKSTLALAALGLVHSTGDLWVLGQRWGAGESSRKLRAQIQVVFQDPFSSLSPRMTVHELVGEGLIVHAPNMSAQERQERVVAVLAEVGLSDELFPGLLARFPHEFSGGQRQRIAIARALILNPKALILDEPTSALDVSSQRQVVELLQQLQTTKGLSYLLITHDMSVIKAMAHHVMVMKGGEVIEFASFQDLIREPKHAYTQLLLEASA